MVARRGIICYAIDIHMPRLHHKNKKTRFLIALFVVLVAGAVLLFIRFRQGSASQQPEWKIYTNLEKGISFRYPPDYATAQLTESFTEAGIFVRLLKANAEASLSVSQETGLGMLKLAGGTVYDALVDQVNRRYPDRFPGYKKVRFSETVIANEKAAIFDFTYTAKDGNIAQQRLAVIVKNNDAYFIAAQTLQERFSQMETEFTRIIESFTFIENK